MSKFRCVKIIFAAFLLLGCLGSNAAQFTNGSFEIVSGTPIPSGSYMNVNPGDTWLTGWTAGGPGGGDIAVVDGPADTLTPYDGQQLVVFNAGNSAPGGILSQTFDTTNGQLYTVSFAVGQEGSGNMRLTAIAVASNNAVIATNYCIPVSGTWTLFQLNFTATSTNTTLVFTDASTTTAGADLMLDDVTVTATQPPAAPSIVTSPVSQAAVAGASVTFTASASGSASTVQWYLINYTGTNAIAGATSTTLNVTASGATAGSYFAVFTNSLGGATTSAANLAVTGLAFANGSFESPAVSSGGHGLGAGTSSLPGWTVGGSVVGLWHGNDSGLSAFDGQQFVYFGGINVPSGFFVSQTFSTVVGQPYEVTYDVGQAGAGNFSVTGTAFDAVGNLLASNRCASVSSTWINCQIGFIAATTNTTLVFTDTSVVDVSGGNDALDDITVVDASTTGIPVVNTSPVSQTASSGATVSFSASAAGGPSTIQWYLGANPVTGAGGTASPLVVTASDATAGNYTAVFSNLSGMATTAVAVLTVVDPPVIAISPVSQAAASGAGVAFTASASGGTSTVQWYLINYKGTNAIAGATSTTLNVTTSGATAGSYFAVFTNIAGGATTSAANLAVTGLAFANGSFESPAVSSGGHGLGAGTSSLPGWTVGGSVVGLWHGNDSGLSAFDGQQFVYFGGINVPSGFFVSQTFSTVVGQPYEVTYDVGQAGAGNFSVTGTAFDAVGNLLASNRCASVSSTWINCQIGFIAATTNTTLVFTDTSVVDVSGGNDALDDITVVSEPTTGSPVVISSPVSQTANSGAAVSFSAAAAGSPSTIQWYLGTNQVTGAGGTASPLVVTASDATAGSYTAVFSNSFNTATTAVAVLTVIDPPVIATSPASQVVTVGTQVTLSASASGSSSTVQWYLGTAAISGATSSSLTFTAFASSSGNYSAVFGNAAGTATSAVATVTVNAGPFTNGSFELINNHAVIPGNSSVTLAAGSTWLTGWTTAGPVSGDVAVDNGNVDGLTPYDGLQWITFNGGNTAPGGSLAQTFITTVGQPYVVSFALARAGSGSVSLAATAVALDGTLLVSNYCVPTSSAWTVFYANFTATSTNTTLTLKDTSSQTAGVDLALDDVTVISPPVIVVSPASQTNLIGTTVTFTASASGSPATVQWFQGVSPVLNATNATLSFTANSGSGGNYTAVFTNAAGSATTAVAVLTIDIPALLTQQPASITTNVGATVTFTGAANGTAPLGLQWQFDGTNIDGATNTDLVLTNAQPTNAGSYTLVAANPYGTNTSTNAVLSFISTLQVVSGSAAGPGIVTVPVTSLSVTVPINLLAIGSETALGCSLDYDPAVLTYTGAALGGSASGGILSVDTSQTPSGHLGLSVLFFNSGTTFGVGTQQVFQVTFQTALVTSNVTTTISFGSQPVLQEITDTNATDIPGAFLPGTLTILPVPLEGDVSPVGNEDFLITLSDWVQEGRFVAGLDAITNTDEFQRADCAPRGTLGDGLVTVADWVQVGRYYTHLDPVTVAGGLTGPPSGGSVVASAQTGTRTGHDGVPRTLLLSPVTQGAMSDSVMVQLVAQGNETALQFGLTFDPTALSFVSASLGSGAAGAALVANTLHVANGQLGIVLSYPPNHSPQTFAAGTQNIVQLNFNSISYSNTTSLAFADVPIIRQVVDSTPNVLSTGYQNGALQIGGTSWPQVAISQSAGGLTLSWPSSPTVVTAQWTTNLGANWSNTTVTPVTNGPTVSLTLPAPTNTTFYRLYQP